MSPGAERTRQRANERTSERANERTSERANERTSERANERTSERANERTSERASERTSERASERTNDPLKGAVTEEHNCTWDLLAGKGNRMRFHNKMFVSFAFWFPVLFFL